MLNSYI